MTSIAAVRLSDCARSVAIGEKWCRSLGDTLTVLLLHLTSSHGSLRLEESLLTHQLPSAVCCLHSHWCCWQEQIWFIPFKSLGSESFSIYVAFIQQGSIKLIKSDSKVFYIVTKNIFQINAAGVELSIHHIILRKFHSSRKIWNSTY